MVWLASTSDPRHGRNVLILYCVITTVFCAHFFYLGWVDQISRQPQPTSLVPLPKKASHRIEFPRKVWQTAKVGPGWFEDDDRKAIQSWTKLNQKHRYEIVTPNSAETYVRDRFSDSPETLEPFLDLQDPMLRADLIRYLVLLSDGGLYSEVDTRALRPIEDWVPVAFQEYADLVVGIEYDRLTGDPWADWTSDLQFCTWAILSKPGQPAIEMTVHRAISRLKELALKQEKSLSGIQVSHNGVRDTTGPAEFTAAVMESLSRSTGTNVTWHNVTGITAPRLTGNVLILPINAFGSGQGHSNSGRPEEDSALVEHLFKDSWKDDHPHVEESEKKMKGEDEGQGEDYDHARPKEDLHQGEHMEELQEEPQENDQKGSQEEHKDKHGEQYSEISQEEYNRLVDGEMDSAASKPHNQEQEKRPHDGLPDKTGVPVWDEDHVY
ncbi:hypothetical protein MMC20_005021 [Loxospora ochrophaea]|nr:hypothetical protein [Loxospora ochrophaea]